METFRPAQRVDQLERAHGHVNGRQRTPEAVRAELDEVEQAFAALASEHRALAAQLDLMSTSLSWRTAQMAQRLIGRVAPPASIQGRAWRKVRRSILASLPSPHASRGQVGGAVEQAQDDVVRARQRILVRLAYRRAEQAAEALRASRAARGPVTKVDGGPGVITEPVHRPPTFLPESPLAHRLLDGLTGLEIGGSAHSPFGLDTRNVGLSAEMDAADFTFFKELQLRMCGRWTPIDVPGLADRIPVADSSQDFVIHAHVWEHLPNPLRALEEWVHVVRSRGYVYAIVPKRDALPGDRERPVTSLEQHLTHYLLDSQPDERSVEEGVDHRGHYSVFDAGSFDDIEAWFNLSHPTEQLVRVAYQETDDKVGNGHAIVWQVVKPQG